MSASSEPTAGGLAVNLLNLPGEAALMPRDRSVMLGRFGFDRKDRRFAQAKCGGLARRRARRPRRCSNLRTLEPLYPDPITRSWNHFYDLILRRMGRRRGAPERRHAGGLAGAQHLETGGARSPFLDLRDRLSHRAKKPCGARTIRGRRWPAKAFLQGPRPEQRLIADQCPIALLRALEALSAERRTCSS